MAEPCALTIAGSDSGGNAGVQADLRTFHAYGVHGCTVLAAPSTEEMFGNQLIEALMRGCHGIVTDATAMAENVRRFGNGTVVPQNDAVSLSRAIVARILAPPSLEDRKSARDRIREWMSPTVVAAKHFSFYRHILSLEQPN